MSEDIKNTIKELTLMLMYLTSWKEKQFGMEYLRTWKGYDFDILNELTDEDLITGSYRAKSAFITEKGEKIAEELLKKYQINIK
ncbi:hypothetical protein SAMN05443428_1229 [Caloramator quimbayensis]|uniref:DUF6429 domain-containing protein n=1 Tax=Caloramator quimbayensis TaxID=1147123 RepID=A0A1T4Y4K2_9CLOT|nr:DUF6429 family protein [Caloramator quimbayensis]SKA96666.1 hypothetical protein SAMN05443428_1229 [Caloramator quimbayensis]